jgi:hypothetical protein
MFCFWRNIMQETRRTMDWRDTKTNTTHAHFPFEPYLPRVHRSGSFRFRRVFGFFPWAIRIHVWAKDGWHLSSSWCQCGTEISLILKQGNELFEHLLVYLFPWNWGYLVNRNWFNFVFTNRKYKTYLTK